MDKPLCIDLFCGYGGWARGFLDAGYRVIGFDNEPKCAKRYPGEFVLADVRNLDGRRFQGARVIVASPPCTEFSSMTNLRAAFNGIPKDVEKGMFLVREAFRIIKEAQPEAWAVENVAGSVKHIAKEFGLPRADHGAWKLWGNFPGFIAPIMWKYRGTRGFRGYNENGLPRHSSDSSRRSIIPYPLARALAEACLP